MRGYLQGQNWLKDLCINEAHSQHGWQLTKAKTWSMQHGYQASDEVVECPFLVVQLLSASFRQLGLSVSLSWFYCFVYGCRGQGLVNLVSFRGILKLPSCVLPEFNRLPCRMKWSHPLTAPCCLLSLLGSCDLTSFTPRWVVLFQRKLIHNTCFTNLINFTIRWLNSYLSISGAPNIFFKRYGSWFMQVIYIKHFIQFINDGEKPYINPINKC